MKRMILEKIKEIELDKWGKIQFNIVFLNLYIQFKRLETMKKYRLNSNDGELICPNHLKINNTNLEPEEVARAVVEKFGLINSTKNLVKEKVYFDKDLNIIYGDNAQGKTNIIEAIFLSAMGKSFRAKKDKDLIKFGTDNAKVEVEFQTIDREGTISVLIDNKKTFFINGVKQNKITFSRYGE